MCSLSISINHLFLLKLAAVLLDSRKLSKIDWMIGKIKIYEVIDKGYPEKGGRQNLGKR
jgi:hypothetical protein